MANLLSSQDEKAMNIQIFDAEAETAPSTEKKKPNTDRLQRQDMEAPHNQALQTLNIDTASEFYATMSAFSKQENDLKSCPKHPNRHIEYFSVEMGYGLCPSCVYEVEGLEKSSLADAKKTCTDLLARWVNLIDNATYMPVEHLFKEKDFGIRWRSAFKEEMKK